MRCRAYGPRKPWGRAGAPARRREAATRRGRRGCPDDRAEAAYGAAGAADRDTPLGEVDLDAVARAHEPHALRVDPRGAAVGPVGEQHAQPRVTGFEDEQADRPAGPAAERGEHARRAGGARRGPGGGAGDEPRDPCGRTGGRAGRASVECRNRWLCGSTLVRRGDAARWQGRGREYEGRERREEEGGGARGHLSRSLRRPWSGPGGRGRERSCGGRGPRGS